MRKVLLATLLCLFLLSGFPVAADSSGPLSAGAGATSPIADNWEGGNL